MGDFLCPIDRHDSDIGGCERGWGRLLSNEIVNKKLQIVSNHISCLTSILHDYIMISSNNHTEGGNNETIQRSNFASYVP